MDVSRIFKRCFKKVTRLFQECYKCVEKGASKVFQASPKGVLGKFQGLSIVFQRYLCCMALIAATQAEGGHVSQ